MSTYSAFFSSGLLAPRIARCSTPAIPTSPVDQVDCQPSPTPTPLGQTNPHPKPLEANTNAERPKMRRRRSSINVSASPIALIKSPVRNAGAALQRTGFMSPTRHRATSVNMNEASENNSLFGRIRSGSLGGVVNPPTRLRRAIRRLVPLGPPPSVPLPALPSSPTLKGGNSLLPPVLLAPAPRRPFSLRRSHTDNFFSATPLSLDTDELMKEE